MNPEQLIDALQFNNQSFICQQVHAVSTVKLYVFVLNGKFNLKLERDPGPVHKPSIARESIQAIQAQALDAPQSHNRGPCLIIHQISLSSLSSLRALRVLRAESSLLALSAE